MDGSKLPSLTLSVTSFSNMLLFEMASSNSLSGAKTVGLPGRSPF